MKENKIKIIVDTNIWISFLISKDFPKLEALFNNNEIVFVFSDELVREFVEVAARPKFNKYFERKDIEKILDIMNNIGEIVKVKSRVHKCRDEKDNFLLSLAKDAEANFLITGDEDLLVIKKLLNTEILSYTQFATNN